MPQISHKGKILPASAIRKLVPFADAAKERGIKPTARYFNTYPATVRRIIRLYNEKGEEGLITKR